MIEKVCQVILEIQNLYNKEFFKTSNMLVKILHSIRHSVKHEVFMKLSLFKNVTFG